jgi:hypothetical protein
MTIIKENKTIQMRKFRDRWQAVAKIEAEEQKTASITLRWQQLTAILLMAKGLGLTIEKSNEENEIIYQRWAKLKGSLK